MSSSQKTEISENILQSLKTIENYYGPYDPALRNYVVSYMDKYNPDKYGQLIMKLFETHPKSFGPPDIAAMYKAAEACPSDMKTKVGNEWTPDYLIPMTPEEKLTAKESHEKFLEKMKDLALIKTEKKIIPKCKECSYFPNPGDYSKPHSFECMGCIDFGNFKSKKE